MSSILLLLPRLSRAFVNPSSRSVSSTALQAADKGTILVLGGTGFLGQNVCQQATREGYSVVSLSRRGQPPEGGSPQIDYRSGDARKKETLVDLFEKEDFVGVIHCVGLLFDDTSGLGNLNKFVSGSGSLPDENSTYETITRLTAFNAIEAASDYAMKKNMEGFPFCFTSAAEAGWPEMGGGKLVESIAPDFLKRYLVAKRAVEARLLESGPELRPVIVRPSLIYSMDRPASFPSVGAFFLGNKLGLPFVDEPVTVQTLSAAMVRSLSQENIQGVLRYPKINELGGTK